MPHRCKLWLLLVVLMTVPTLAAVGYFLLLEGSSPILQQAAYLAGKLVMVLPAWWYFVVERGRWQWRKPTLAAVCDGLIFGLLVAGAALIIYFAYLRPRETLAFAGPAIREKIAAFGLTNATTYILFAAVISFPHSALEEYYWRWFVFGRLRQQLPVALAGGLASLAFTGHHVVVLGRYFGWLSAGQILFSLAVFLGGAIWCGMFHWRRSLYGPWISHVFIDAVIFAVGYDLAAIGRA